MFIDHAGSILDVMPMRYIGRIAFPIYAFLIAEGCTHTKNIKKYMFRLFLFGAVSQIPFAIFADSYTFISYLNIFFTLSLGVLAIYIDQSILSKISNLNLRSALAFINVYLIGFFAQGINSDYGSLGVFLIYCFYIQKNANSLLASSTKASHTVFFLLFSKKIAQALILMIFLFFMYPPITTHGIHLFIGGSLSLIPILLYNGTQGKSVKWIFYAFYPLHLIALILVRYYFL